jgi:hypothetical protein
VSFLPLIGGMSRYLCFLAPIVVPALFAAVLAFPRFRLKGNYFAFATLAMVPLCELLANNLSWLTHGSDGITLAADVACGFLLADGSATPSLGDISHAVGLSVSAGALASALAVGLAALFGSRGPVIGILIATHVVLEPQLQSAGFLGSAREAVPTAALNRIGDQATSVDFKVSLRR